MQGPHVSAACLLRVKRELEAKIAELEKALADAKRKQWVAAIERQVKDTEHAA